jgi:fibrillarin-like pre-rRNA processing protein
MQIPLNAQSRVLYLGAASGTTVTHVSDIAADGVVFAVEFAARPVRDLLRAIADRDNIIPMISDARRPDLYPPFVDHADFLYQDVAQPDQADIAIANADKYLVSGGYAAIAIKARSISAGGDVKDIFRGEIERLAERFEIVEKNSLEPLHHDHMAILCRY